MKRFPPIESGDRFGILTVIEEAGVIRRPNGNVWRRLWDCICDCGEPATVRQDQLRTGKTTSCGCRVTVGSGSANLRWSGENPSYCAMHLRVSRARGAASEHACIDCGQPARHWSYVRDCPEERYPIDAYCRKRGVRSPYCSHVEHYAPRCSSCHWYMDTGPLGSVRRVRTMLLTGVVS